LVNLYCLKIDESFKKMIENRKEFLKSQTGSKDILIGEPDGEILIQEEVSLNGVDLILSLVQ